MKECIILNESTNSERKYKCPYCDYRNTRTKLVDHVDNKHKDMIPKGYTAARVIFNMINKKDHGVCTICKKEAPWNEEKGRYDRICADPKCKKAYTKMVEERLMKARGVTKQDLLNDPEFQKKMLEGRSISGKYKFQDGTYKTYTGTYEKKLLEFLDVFMHVNPVDIYSPGPVIEYEYEGEKHQWITDFYYEPYNLVFDVKDGGANPNNRDMVHYRAKQIEKEKAIKKQNKYNYIRLTDNNFEQLVLLMMELKELYMECNETPTHIIRINEATVNMKPTTVSGSYHDQLYLVEYGINESYIKNEQDIYYNKDKFDSGEINLCFITGLSGSGKSTMGHKIEKDNVDCIELDDLLVIKDHFSMDNLKEYSDLLYSFFNGKGKKWYMGKDDLMKLPKEEPYEDQLFIDFINYAISYSKSHRNKKYVLEGVWVFKYIKPEQLKNFAVYIKGTSMIVSKIRAAKRDSRDGETKFERAKAFAKGIFRNLKWYIIDEKQVQKFRDYYSKLVSENNISESSKKILNDKGEEVPEKCPKCGSDVKIYIKGEPVYLCSNEKCNKYFGTVPFSKKDGKNVSESCGLDYSYIVEEAKAGNKHPLFIILSFTFTKFGKMVKKLTDADYSHASISLDPSLHKMYSFNMDNHVNKAGGFSIEDIDTYTRFSDESYILINTVFVNDSQYEIINKYISNLEKHIKDTKYAATNLFRFLINKSKESLNSTQMMCSEFVYNIFKLINQDPLNKSSNLVSPQDLADMKDKKVYTIYQGLIKEYKERKIQTKINRLMDKALVLGEQYTLLESSSKSTLDKNFKKKTGGNFKFIDFKGHNVDKYLKTDSYFNEYLDFHIKNTVGEIVIDKDTDKLAGYIFIYKPGHKYAGFITPLVVVKEYRGYGLSHKLVDDALYKYGAVDLTVNVDNEVAINLYKQHGFVIIGYGNTKNNQDYYMKHKSKLEKDDKPMTEDVCAGVMVGAADGDGTYTNKLMKNTFIEDTDEDDDEVKYAICKEHMTEIQVYENGEFIPVSLQEFNSFASNIRVFKINQFESNPILTESTIIGNNLYEVIKEQSNNIVDSALFEEVVPFTTTLNYIEESTQATILEKYNPIVESVPVFCMNARYENTNIRFYRDIDGVFVRNIDTGFRSKSYENENQINESLIQFISKGII